MNYKNNKAILKYGLIVIVLFFLASLIYYMGFSLEEPVFLKHYYERVLHGESYIFIHYITNSNDKRQVSEIYFPQLEDDFVYAEHEYFGGGNYRNEKYAHYSYNVFAIKFHFYDDGSTEPKTFVLDKAVIIYNNGEKQNVDIGKIVIHKNMKQDRFFEMEYSSSSNNYTSSYVIRAVKNVRVEKVESMFDKETKNFLELTINHVNLNELEFPFNINEGEKLSINSSFLIDTYDERRYNVYDLQRIIYSVDEEGDFGYDFIYNLNYEPDYFLRSEKGITEYLKYRGVK